MPLDQRYIDSIATKLASYSVGVGPSVTANLTRLLIPEDHIRESTQRHTLAGNGCDEDMPSYVTHSFNNQTVITSLESIIFSKDHGPGEYAVGIGSTGIIDSTKHGFSEILDAFKEESNIDILQFIVTLSPRLESSRAILADGVAGSFGLLSRNLPGIINFGLSASISKKAGQAAATAREQDSMPIRAHFINLIIYKTLDGDNNATLHFQLVDPTNNPVGITPLTPFSKQILHEETVVAQLRQVIDRADIKHQLARLFSLEDNSKFVVHTPMNTGYQWILFDKRCGFFAADTLAQITNTFTLRGTKITEESITAGIIRAHAELSVISSKPEIIKYLVSEDVSAAEEETSAKPKPR